MMSDLKNKQNKASEEKILDEAAHWYAEIKDGRFSQDDWEKLQDWLSDNPKHQAAFEEIIQTSALIDELFPEGSPERKELFVLGAFADNSQSPSTKDQPARSSGWQVFFPKLRWCWRTGMAMAVMAVLVILFGAVFREWWPHTSDIIAVESFHTFIGEKKEVPLRDGSLLKLNTKSRITIEFSSNQRLVRLSEGEVLFNVSRDLKRPFLVCALNGKVRVLGTTFNVRNRRGEVSVDVVQGQVQVQKSGTQGSASNSTLLLKAKQGVSYKKWGNLGKLRSVNMEEILSWQQNKLVFNSEPLSEVLKQLEDYYPVRLKLADPSLAKQLLTGTFESHSLKEILSSIQAVFDLKAKHRDGIIILQRNLEG